MRIYDEKQIRKRICELNAILEDDEKDGHLTEKKYLQYWKELQQQERNLTLVYIIHHLAKQRKMEELDTSLLPISEDASDSEVETCKERDITLYHSYRNNEYLQKQG